MTTYSGPAALTRPGPDTEGDSSMYEPTYLVARHRLYAVQAAGETVRVLRHRLADATRDGLAPEIVARRRERLNRAALEYHSAILLAAANGATSRELIGYGVSADLAAELDRRARQ
jgi:hypothetical protein